MAYKTKMPRIFEAFLKSLEDNLKPDKFKCRAEKLSKSLESFYSHYFLRKWRIKTKQRLSSLNQPLHLIELLTELSIRFRLLISSLQQRWFLVI